ncbi:MAG: tRNA lysidine(34) synthetase TilS [Clostridia bacterium]|nr:tRNA lysidine(34) synthetase TilS [Clostridia bacterium]
MLQERVLKTIEKNNLIQENDKILIGVSGGPDSMCLLDILYCLKEKLHVELFVAHINHQIRKEAEEETKYVQEFCKTIQVPCFVKYASVEKLAKEQKIGTEEAGREVRYKFFEEVAKKVAANKIATAHNANDNSETVLMNFLRGTAISGLKGIEIKRDKYIRPIRNCTRQEIEEYCKIKKINPKIDQSNFEPIYTRNKVRNELIPYLQKEYNPNIIEGMNRLADLAAQEEEYFAKIVSNEYESLKIGENEKEVILDLKKFNKLDKVIKTRLILYTINKVKGSTQGIAKVHLEDILKLCQNNVGNKYLIPNKNIKIFIQKGKIFFITKTNLP